MQSERSMGFFILVCSLFCLTIAADKYYSAVATAKYAAEKLTVFVNQAPEGDDFAMPGFELESVGIPPVAMVCGAVGVMLLVASVILIAKSFQSAESEV